MDIQACFGRAFQIWKSTRKLWLLGCLAVLTGTGGISASFNVSMPSTDFERFDFLQIDEEQLLAYLQWIHENLLLWMSAAFIVTLLLLIVQIVLGAWVQGAMIDLAAKADLGQEFSIRSSFAAALKRLSPLTRVMLLLRLPTFVSLAMGFVFIVFIFSQMPDWISGNISGESIFMTFLGVFLCVLIMVLLVSVLQLLSSFLEPLALRVCLFEQQAVWASVRRSFALIRQNLGLTLLTWFGMGVVAAAIGMLMSVAGIFFFLIGLSSSTPAITYLLLGIGLLLFFGLLLGLGALFASYLATLWNVVYRACIAPKPQYPPPSGPQPYLNG